MEKQHTELQSNKKHKIQLKEIKYDKYIELKENFLFLKNKFEHIDKSIKNSNIILKNIIYGNFKYYVSLYKKKNINYLIDYYNSFLEIINCKYPINNEDFNNFINDKVNKKPFLAILQKFISTETLYTKIYKNKIKLKLLNELKHIEIFQKNIEDYIQFEYKNFGKEYNIIDEIEKKNDIVDSFNHLNYDNYFSDYINLLNEMENLVNIINEYEFNLYLNILFIKNVECLSNLDIVLFKNIINEVVVEYEEELERKLKNNN